MFLLENQYSNLVFGVSLMILRVSILVLGVSNMILRVSNLILGQYNGAFRLITQSIPASRTFSAIPVCRGSAGLPILIYRSVRRRLQIAFEVQPVAHKSK